MPRHWKQDLGCVMMVARGDGKATIRAHIKTHDAWESFPELSRQTITNENNMHQTGASVLEHGKKQISIQWGNAIDFLILSAWVTVFSITQHFTAESSCAQDASTIGSLLVISQTSASGFLCWDPPPPPPQGSVSLDHSIPTALHLSTMTIPHSTLSSTTYF